MFSLVFKAYVSDFISSYFPFTTANLNSDLTTKYIPRERSTFSKNIFIFIEILKKRFRFCFGFQRNPVYGTLLKIFFLSLPVNGIITKWRIRTNNFAISKAGTKVYFNNYETMDKVSIQKDFLANFILLRIQIYCLLFEREVTLHSLKEAVSNASVEENGQCQHGEN